MAESLVPIAYIRTPYKQKFSIPRQPGLVAEAEGLIQFTPSYSDRRFFDGIEAHSHLWLIFEFHLHSNKSKSPSVRPPRLGGNKKVGVFATRSSFRPNNLGMSVVKFEGLSHQGEQAVLHVSGVDLVDGTPIYDVKPYIPYADAIPNATSEFASHAPDMPCQVRFLSTVMPTLAIIANEHPKFQSLVTQVLAQDPRPAYKKAKQDTKRYSVQLHQYDVKWTIENNVITVDEIVIINP